MLLAGTEDLDWEAKENHHGEYFFKGYNLHLWSFISSVVESQKKVGPEIVAK